ncbi:uncharacterized protein METZ01_LOCUS310012, partial [marine metagenome]
MLDQIVDKVVPAQAHPLTFHCGMQEHRVVVCNSHP